jgi:hypothetical protein
MISVNFRDFLNQNYIDDAYVLYLARNSEDEILYVGMTTENVWDRWFYSSRAHIVKYYDGERFGTTPIGKHIMDNLPASYGWKIELWTSADALDYFKLPSGHGYSKSEIRTLERRMISSFNPKLNATG